MARMQPARCPRRRPEGWDARAPEVRRGGGANPETWPVRDADLHAAHTSSVGGPCARRAVGGRARAALGTATGSGGSRHRDRFTGARRVIKAAPSCGLSLKLTVRLSPPKPRCQEPASGSTSSPGPGQGLPVPGAARCRQLGNVAVPRTPCCRSQEGAVCARGAGGPGRGRLRSDTGQWRRHKRRQQESQPSCPTGDVRHSPGDRRRPPRVSCRQDSGEREGAPGGATQQGAAAPGAASSRSVPSEQGAGIHGQVSANKVGA